MTLDAKIRITAEGAQAVKVLREVEAAGKSARDAVTATPAGKPAFADLNQGAFDAAANTRKLTDDARKLKAERATAAAADKQQADEARLRQKLARDDAEAAAKAQRQATNQARQLGPQLTDIVVGLSTGQSPLTVLLQQGGQLRDVMGGAGNAVKAVLSIFTAGRVIVGGLAAAIGSVAYAAVQGQAESAALGKTLALTGNIAGTTAGQLDVHAKAIAAEQKVSVGSVREALTGLVATGEFTGATLGSAGRAATALGKLTGQSASEAIKSFDGMAQSVAAWANKSNQSYNFLTAEQFKYIQSLESQGRVQEAMKVTLDALAATMESRSVPAVGLLERTWNSLKKAVADTADEMKAIGRDTTPEERIAKLVKLRTELEAARAAPGSRGGRRQSTTDNAVADVDRQLAAEEALAFATNRRERQHAAELAAQTKEQQEQGKQNQDALAAISEAGAQKQLAIELAGLAKKQSFVELSNAQGLLGETQYALAVNGIEQERLQAQERTLNKIIGIRKAQAGTGTELDRRANEAQVKQLEAQLVNVKTQIQQAQAKGQQITATDALADARAKSAEWAAIWQEAYTLVRQLAQQNGARQAALIADPVGRATTEALLKVDELRKKVEALQQKLRLEIADVTIPQATRDKLREQLAALNKQAPEDLAAQDRLAQFSSYQTQIAEIQQTVALKEAAIDAQVALGKQTTVDAEQAKFKARAEAVPQLEEIQRLLDAIATSPAEKNAAEGARQATDKIKDTTTELEKVARSSATTGITDALTAIQTGSKSAKNALLDMVGSFAKAMLDVLNKRLAESLVKQFEEAIGNNSGSGFLGFLGKVFSALSGLGGGGASGAVPDAGTTTSVIRAHSGALIGAAGGTRATVPASVFGNAVRYHGGGIVGLKPRERAAILEDGEEVLDAENPRHVRNFKAGGLMVTNNVSISGGQGADGDQRATAESLLATMNGAIEQWAATQSRQGGLLAGGRR